MGEGLTTRSMQPFSVLPLQDGRICLQHKSLPTGLQSLGGGYVSPQ